MNLDHLEEIKTRNQELKDQNIVQFKVLCEKEAALELLPHMFDYLKDCVKHFENLKLVYSQVKNLKTLIVEGFHSILNQTRVEMLGLLEQFVCAILYLPN